MCWIHRFHHCLRQLEEREKGITEIRLYSKEIIKTNGRNARRGHEGMCLNTETKLKNRSLKLS